jgi:hypothetical protein
MEYLLVLQWPAKGKLDFNFLIRLEEKLLIALDGVADVDGHDYGKNEMNIFILTDDPKGTFSLIGPIVDSMHASDDIRVAYRAVTGDTYTVLTPSDLSVFEVT